MRAGSSVSGFLNRIGDAQHPSTPQEMLWVAFAFFLLGLGVCIPEIMLSSSLYLDDYHRYTLGVDNKLHPTILERNFFRAYAIFPLYKLLSIDVGLARLALVSGFIVPLSLMAYYLLRRYCQTPIAVAFFTALLPMLLPGQTQIPFFIDGSYTVPGLLVFLLWLWISLTGVNTDHHSVLKWILCAALLIVALGMMDQSLFLIPFSVALMLATGWKEHRRSTIIFIAITGVVTAAVLLEKLLTGTTSPVEVPSIPTLETFLRRTSSFVHSTSPLALYNAGNHGLNILNAICSLLIVIAGLAIAPRKQLIPIGLALLWVISTTIVFITISRYYSPRYTHIASFGVAFLLIFSSYTLIVNYTRFRVAGIAVWLVFAIMISASAGGYRFMNMVTFVKSRSSTFDSVTHYLFTREFPVNAQIAIVDGHRIPTGGYWVYSSGFLRMVTDRQDVTGIVGLEKGYYDPFDASKRGFEQSHRMNGLDLEKPIYLFRQVCESKCRLHQERFALRWAEDEQWQLIEFDEHEGTHWIVNEGKGLNRYEEAVGDASITFDEVVFANGSPSQRKN